MINTDIIDDLKVVEVMRKFGLDFDDALQYYVAVKYRMEGVVSYGSHFDLTDLKRYTPEELLS